MTALLTSELPILRGPARPDLLRPEVLADLFEATARQLPEQIALRQGERQLSYAQLDAAADRAASRLIEAGVCPGQIVGLWMPRGIELLVMQLAIAKTGAAWLPSDAETPAERVAVCLADAQAVGLLTCAEWAERGAAPGLPVWHAEALLQPSESALRRREGALPAHTAYVIYTSGSTGKPKGIAITQASICHFLRSENAVLGVRASDTVYQGFSVAFDMSFEEIWISYLVGATLWLAPREIAADPDALPQALIDQGVSVLHAVPTLLALFSQDVPGLRLINLGGEMCPEALVARWAKPGRQVFNTYGPTEATVSASLAELQAGAPVTIGRPLPNYQLMVIAADVENGLRLQPQGETGELCISGPGVAAGYLGRPELTAEKFLANPWAGADQRDARLYRTGDLARIDAQGQVHCLGRVDDQVKIRGFRVELGEIEAVLAQQAGVGTVAVLLRRDEELEQLVAYLVADSATPPAAATLRQALGQTLPPYMVPSRYEWLAAMPRLTSGKIDRNTLKARPLAALAPESDGVGSGSGSDKPANAAEAALFEALRRLFPGQALRHEADFFSDLGGHSLLAARLASALRATPRFAGPDRARHLPRPPPRRHRRSAGSDERARHFWPRCCARMATARRLAALALRRGPSAGGAAPGGPAHGQLAGAVFHLPLLHRRPERFGAHGRADVGGGVPGGHGDGVRGGPGRQMADRRAAQARPLSAVGPDLFPLVAGRPVAGERAGVLPRRLLALRGLAAPAGARASAKT